MSASEAGAADAHTPVRVMHLVYSFGTGGMEVGVAKLTNAIDPSIVLSSICSCRPLGTLYKRLRPEVRFFQLDRRPGFDIRLVLHLYRLLRRERPDILHTHGWGTLCEGLVAATWAGVPIVVHGEHGTLQTRRHQALVQRWFWRRVHRLLAVSSRLRERMARRIGFPLDRIHVIRNGVDTVRFNTNHRAGARIALGVQPERLVLGTAGRLVPVKDHATLLRAWALLEARGLAITCVIAGWGELKEELIGLAASLGLKDMRFLGNRRDIEHVLAALDVFILSSKSEGLSNTIQEAMASGVPVVATHVGGADELVIEGETGLLVPPKHPEALADAIERLLVDPAARARMGEAGRRRAEQEFSLDRMVQAYVQMYIDLAARANLSSRPR